MRSRIVLLFAALCSTALTGCQEQPAPPKVATKPLPDEDFPKTIVPGEPNLTARTDDGTLLLFDEETDFGWMSPDFDLDVNMRDLLWDGTGGYAIPFQYYQLLLDCRIASGTEANLLFVPEAGEPVAIPFPARAGRMAFTISMQPGGATITGSRADLSSLPLGLPHRLGFAVTPKGQPDDNEAPLAITKASLKLVGLEDISPDENLSGWHVVPGSQGKFESDGEILHVTGGRGFLESDETYKDFILQFDVKTNAKGVNSGVFFRTQRGTTSAPSNGYEFQIDNGFDGDRGKPTDHGTGGIFKRQSARTVVANDEEWTTCTLVAYGPKFMTWVNGIPVCYFKDTRKADPNPRNGLRLEAGHLSIQAHDPTTDLEFRNIRIMRLGADGQNSPDADADSE